MWNTLMRKLLATDGKHTDRIRDDVDMEEQAIGLCHKISMVLMLATWFSKSRYWQWHLQRALYGVCAAMIAYPCCIWLFRSPLTRNGMRAGTHHVWRHSACRIDPLLFYPDRMRRLYRRAWKKHTSEDTSKLDLAWELQDATARVGHAVMRDGGAWLARVGVLDGETETAATGKMNTTSTDEVHDVGRKDGASVDTGDDEMDSGAEVEENPEERELELASSSSNDVDQEQDELITADSKGAREAVKAWTTLVSALCPFDALPDFCSRVLTFVLHVSGSAPLNSPKDAPSRPKSTSTAYRTSSKSSTKKKAKSPSASSSTTSKKKKTPSSKTTSATFPSSGKDASISSSSGSCVGYTGPAEHLKQQWRIPAIHSKWRNSDSGVPLPDDWLDTWGVLFSALSALFAGLWARRAKGGFAWFLCLGHTSFLNNWSTVRNQVLHSILGGTALDIGRAVLLQGARIVANFLLEPAIFLTDCATFATNMFLAEENSPRAVVIQDPNKLPPRGSWKRWPNWLRDKYMPTTEAEEHVIFLLAWVVFFFLWHYVIPWNGGAGRGEFFHSHETVEAFYQYFALERQLDDYDLETYGREDRAQRERRKPYKSPTDSRRDDSDDEDGVVIRTKAHDHNDGAARCGGGGGVCGLDGGCQVRITMRKLPTTSASSPDDDNDSAMTVTATDEDEDEEATALRRRQQFYSSPRVTTFRFSDQEIVTSLGRQQSPSPGDEADVESEGQGHVARLYPESSDDEEVSKYPQDDDASDGVSGKERGNNITRDSTSTTAFSSSSQASRSNFRTFKGSSSRDSDTTTVSYENDDDHGDGDMEVDGDGDIEVDGDGDIEVDGDGDIQVDCDGDIEVDGDGDIEVDGDGDIEVDGDRDIEVDGDGDTEVDGVADLKVDGDGDRGVDGDAVAENEIHGDADIDADGDGDIESDSDGDIELVSSKDSHSLTEVNATYQSSDSTEPPRESAPGSSLAVTKSSPPDTKTDNANVEEEDAATGRVPAPTSVLEKIVDTLDDLDTQMKEPLVVEEHEVDINIITSSTTSLIESSKTFSHEVQESKVDEDTISTCDQGKQHDSAVPASAKTVCSQDEKENDTSCINMQEHEVVDEYEYVVVPAHATSE
ncbi:unnamed protein product [Amoebophrya sp. A25]|nr:unnamed protein product [Amoebophrya sp. A25]|eukprot:GSA25T00013884001.1